MVANSDHITPVTGLTPTVTLCKNGAAFGAAAGAVTEVANGWYCVAGNATDTNTLGPLVLHATGTAADATDMYFDVVAFDPQSATSLGLSNLDAAITSRMASYTQPTGFLAATFPSGTVANTTNIAGGTITTVSGNVTGSVGSVSGSIGGSVAGSVASVTGNVGGSVGSVSGSIGGNLSGNVLGFISGNVGGVTGVTFPATVASPTNITAGTITTVTNLTNAPTAGDFTSTMKTSLNAATPSVTISDKTGFSLSTTQTFNNTGTWTGIVTHVTLVDTCTSNTDMRGTNSAALAASVDPALVKLLAAAYDTASVSGSIITLSNGATQTVTSTGRVTA